MKLPLRVFNVSITREGVYIVRFMKLRWSGFRFSYLQVRAIVASGSGGSPYVGGSFSRPDACFGV